MGALPAFLELEGARQAFNSVTSQATGLVDAMRSYREQLLQSKTELDRFGAEIQRAQEISRSFGPVSSLMEALGANQGLRTQELQYNLQAAQQENIGRFAAVEQSRISGTAAAQQALISTLGYRPSRQIREAGDVAFQSQAALAKSQQDVLQKETALRITNVVTDPSLSAEQKNLKLQGIAAEADPQIAALGVQRIVAQQQLQASKAQAQFQQGNELAQSSASFLLGRGAEAMRAGAGGADEAFRESQRAAMILQRRTEATGATSPEETKSLEKQQAQDKEQREREIAQRTKDVTSEGQEAVLQTEGRFYDARRAAFERAAQDRILAARNLGQAEIDATKKTIDEQRQLMEKEIAHEIQVRKDASQLVVQQSGDRAQEDTLRARGAVYEADERAYKASWDRKIQAAQNAVNAERDPIERANRQKELGALETERKADQARREYLKPGGQRDIAIRQEHIEDSRLSAQGQYQAEQLKETTDRARREFAEARGNPKLQRSIVEQAQADIQKQEFDIKRRSLGQLGRSFSHSFEMGADNMKPLEDLGKVMSSADETLKSIDKYLKMQVAKTTP